MSLKTANTKAKLTEVKMKDRKIKGGKSCQKDLNV